MEESKTKQVYRFTLSRIEHILNMNDTGAQKAALANLRKGIGHMPGDIPELWGEFLLNLPEDFYGYKGNPSQAEWAVYTSLTLFALHQQGMDPKSDPMHQLSDKLNNKNNSLGSAMARLRKTEDDLDRIRKRFNQVATAESIEELSWHLKAVVQLLRGQKVSLDYASLAADIFRFQYPDSQPAVRLSWGQDFYRAIYYQQKDQTEEKKNE